MHSPQNWHMFVNNSPRCLIVYVFFKAHICIKLVFEKLHFFPTIRPFYRR